MDVTDRSTTTNTDRAGATRPRRAHRRIDSPLGEVVLVGEDGSLVALHLPGSTAPDPSSIGDEDPALLPEVVDQLAEYFAGDRTTFDVPVSPRGTDFQRRVWARLQAIPYGRTCSYGEIALDVGGPRTTRAVGLANGANPVAIIIPCHRVIGANGCLVGYAGGLPAKRLLLDLESGASTLFDVDVSTNAPPT